MDLQDSAYLPVARPMRRFERLFLVLALWFGLTLPGQSETDYESSREVVGLPVSIDKEIIGETEGFAALGHSMPKEGLFKQTIMVGKETNRVYWRINLRDTKAEVTTAGGAFKEVRTDEWSVLTKNAESLILIRTGERLVEAIIINPATGTLVYTRNQMLHIIGSDAGIGWGTCHN